MTKVSSNRNFGIVFFVVFLLISIWPIIDGHSLRIWSLIISFTFLFLGLLNSKILSPLNLLWIKFGEILGKIIAPLVMGIIYFIVITPIGLFMRFIGKDILGKKFLKTQSYWIKREKNIGSMKRQF
tara:strand:+ start:418 stop:795 length:378 start_codon:yes stop_codon:yes gene_type:complete